MSSGEEGGGEGGGVLLHFVLMKNDIAPVFLRKVVLLQFFYEKIEFQTSQGASGGRGSVAPVFLMEKSNFSQFVCG